MTPLYYAWPLSDLRPLRPPVSYQHPGGGASFKLSPANVKEWDRLQTSEGETRTATEEKEKTAKKATSTNARHGVPPDRAPQDKQRPPRKGASRRQAPSQQSRHADSDSDDDLCKTFYIELADGTEVVPCRILDRTTGKRAFKVSKGGNTNDDAILITDEAKLLQYVDDMGFRARCKSRDGKRSGLFTGRSPNRIKKPSR